VNVEFDSRTRLTARQPDDLLRRLFDAALTAVRARNCLPAHLPEPRHAGRTCIIAVGKAAAEMAAVATSHFVGDVHGLVVTRRQHGVERSRLPAEIEVIEAGHPVPDDQSETAALKAIELARQLGPRDRLIALISGGGSALLSLPAPGVSLAEKQELTRTLLRSGATIAEINCVRKHLSRIKGGRLAVAAAPARIHTYVVSDIPGDDPEFVASGPTLPDSTTLADAREVLQRYSIAVPDSIAAALLDPRNETPPADALGLAGNDVTIVARAKDALAAATTCAQDGGYDVTDLGDHLQAEARHLGAGHAALAKRLARDGSRRVILSGGETTVTVHNRDGRGGRNLEYLLSLAIELDAAPGISAIACDTDGIDGTESNAGAIISPTTLARARALGLDPAAALRDNLSYPFFDALGDLVITGPTRTNVNDFRAILITPEPPTRKART
jgi:hydroxypyruvate reductase